MVHALVTSRLDYFNALPIGLLLKACFCQQPSFFKCPQSLLIPSWFCQSHPNSSTTLKQMGVHFSGQAWPMIGTPTPFNIQFFKHSAPEGPCPSGAKNLSFSFSLLTGLYFCLVLAVFGVTLLSFLVPVLKVFLFINFVLWFYDIVSFSALLLEAHLIITIEQLHSIGEPKISFLYSSEGMKQE